jgi:Predicted AAA-ATPase/PD-(D/E)XK nuclease superfamily
MNKVMELQKLSTGEQDFAIIRNTHRVYVDKTSFIYQLLCDSSKFFFLSRPRRFGKSLLINTLKEIFSGNKQHFQGLFIEDKIEWKTYPVLHFDFSNIDFKGKGLEKAIQDRLKEIGQLYQITFEETAIGSKFKELIVKLREKTGEQVVILIDEYDKPITEYLEANNSEKSAEQRDILRSFYSILKGSSEHIKFFFMTGISRFTKVSIFSDLNNLTDLTFKEKYATLCGYTIEEIEHYFSAHLSYVAQRRKLNDMQVREEMKSWYNGYSWDGESRVYNPHSILQLLDSQQFENFWFDSGTPKFLIELLRKDFRFDLKDTLVDMGTFNNYDITNLNADTILFQTGYLTIKEKRKYDVFVLEYPNREVEQSMLQYLLADYAHTTRSALATNLITSLDNNNLYDFTTTINTLFTSIPVYIFLSDREAYYHSIIFIAIKLCGFYIDAEVSHSIGRLDAVMRVENRLYIFEFKLDKTADEALAQIHEKGYAQPYLGQGLEIYLVGINFSSQTKKVQEYKVENI